MKLKPQNITAEYINDENDYTVIYIIGSATLVYGTPRKKNCKAVAFGNTKIMREVAANLIKVAAMVDIHDANKTVIAGDVKNDVPSTQSTS